MTRISKCSFSTLLVATVMGAPTVSQAGGLWLHEYGSPVMGRSGAGAEAGTDDASAAFHSPASMTRVDGEQLMGAGGFIYSNTKFSVRESGEKAGNNDGGSAGGVVPGAALFYVRPINDEWTFGTYVGAYTGSALDYDDEWVGRYQAKEVEILAVGVLPSVAYKVNDALSLGFGLPIMYTSLDLKVAVPRGLTEPDGGAEIDGDDTVVAVSLSALYEFTASTRAGIHYSSKFDPEYDGDLKAKVADEKLGVSTELTLAEKVYVGLTHEVNGELSGHITIGWENWSEMDEVNISTQSAGAALDRNWDDTYFFAVGINYLIEQDWKLNAGLGYDTSPVGKYDRTADMPLDRQIRYAFGVEHALRPDLDLSAQFVYADYGNARITSGGLINPEGPTQFAGKYKDNDLVFFSVAANWKFAD